MPISLHPSAWGTLRPGEVTKGDLGIQARRRPGRPAACPLRCLRTERREDCAPQGALHAAVHHPQPQPRTVRCLAFCFSFLHGRHGKGWWWWWRQRDGIEDRARRLGENDHRPHGRQSRSRTTHREKQNLALSLFLSTLLVTGSEAEWLPALQRAEGWRTKEDCLWLEGLKGRVVGRAVRAGVLPIASPIALLYRCSVALVVRGEGILGADFAAVSGFIRGRWGPNWRLGLAEKKSPPWAGACVG